MLVFNLTVLQQGGATKVKGLWSDKFTNRGLYDSSVIIALQLPKAVNFFLRLHYFCFFLANCLLFCVSISLFLVHSFTFIQAIRPLRAVCRNAQGLDHAEEAGNKSNQATTGKSYSISQHSWSLTNRRGTARLCCQHVLLLSMTKKQLFVRAPRRLLQMQTGPFCITMICADQLTEVCILTPTTIFLLT